MPLALFSPTLHGTVSLRAPAPGEVRMLRCHLVSVAAGDAAVPTPTWAGIHAGAWQWGAPGAAAAMQEMQG